MNNGVERCRGKGKGWVRYEWRKGGRKIAGWQGLLSAFLQIFISAAHPGDFPLCLHPSHAAHNCEYTDTAMHHFMGQRGEGLRVSAAGRRETSCVPRRAGREGRHECTEAICSGWINRKIRPVAWITSQPVPLRFISAANYSSANTDQCWCALYAWTFPNEEVSSCFLQFVPHARCARYPFHFIDVFVDLCHLIISLLRVSCSSLSCRRHLFDCQGYTLLPADDTPWFEPNYCSLVSPHLNIFREMRLWNGHKKDKARNLNGGNMNKDF